MIHLKRLLFGFIGLIGLVLIFMLVVGPFLYLIINDYLPYALIYVASFIIPSISYNLGVEMLGK